MVDKFKFKKAGVDKFIRKLWIKYSTKLSTKYKINKNSFIHKLSFCLFNKKLPFPQKKPGLIIINLNL